MIRAWNPQPFFGMLIDDAVPRFFGMSKLHLLNVVYAEKAAQILNLVVIRGHFLLVLLLNRAHKVFAHLFDKRMGVRLRQRRHISSHYSV